MKVDWLMIGLIGIAGLFWYAVWLAIVGPILVAATAFTVEAILSVSWVMAAHRSNL